MSVYCISYDLKVPGRDYTPLFNAIKNNYSWWHYLESTWLIATDETPHQIWARLAKTIDRNDLLLIIEVRRNYYGWLPDDAWNWIDANAPQ